MPAADALTGDAGLATDGQQALHPALSIALQHPIITCDPDPRTVCSLLQVSKTWRTAVQRTNACSVVISNAPRCHHVPGTPIAALREQHSLSSFACWFSKHAAMVADVQLYIPSPLPSGVSAESYAAQAGPIVVQCFEGCVTVPPAAAPAEVEHTCVSSPAVPQPLLRLKSFSSDYLNSPAILAALPAVTLSKLVMEWNSRCALGTACAAALGHLTNLRELALSFVDLEAPFLEALGKLTQLTKLTGTAVHCSYNAAKHLPTQLVELQLRLGPKRPSNEAAPFLDLSGIKGLRSLCLTTNQPTTSCPLPAGLTGLIINSNGGVKTPCAVAFSLTGLQQLQRLDINYTYGPADMPQQLQLLTQLQQLSHLGLAYLNWAAAQAAAPALRHLPSLKNLQIWNSGLTWEDELEVVQAADVLDLLKTVAACTGLTQLALHTPDVEGFNAEVCSHLRGLTNLSSLSFWSMNPEPQDLLHLRELTSLTELCFTVCRTLGDDAVMALAQTLATSGAASNLQSLALRECGLTSAALPAIAMLACLKSLDLCGNPPGAFTDESLMHLTTLTRLTELLTSHGQFTAAAVEGFWAAIQGRAQQ